MTRKQQAIWTLAAVSVLLFAASLSVLGRQFIYGEGHAERPILVYLAFYGVGCCGLAIAAAQILRGLPAPSVATILLVAIGARLLILPSALIQENDCYRYVLDGHAVLHGVNPFAMAPEEVQENAPEALRRSATSPEAEMILSRIGYPDVPTIYPPLAQLLFALGAWLTPWHWLGQRIVFLLVDLATLIGLVVLLRRMGKPPAWALLYGWNPLVLKEIANSAHLDSAVGLSIVLLVGSAVRWQRVGQENSAMFMTAAAIAVGVLAKLYPLILLPAALLLVVRTTGCMRACATGALAAAFCALGYLPFLDVGMEQLTEGLRTYGTEWVRNEGAFAILAGNLPYPRPTAAVIAAIVALGNALWMYRRRATPEAFIDACRNTLLVWYLFLPAVFPWYAIGLIVATALQPRAWLIALTACTGLYYFVFYIEYHALAIQWNTWTRAIEHGLIWGAIVGEFTWRRERAATRTG